MEDDYLDGGYVSDECYDGYYCNFCGLELTLDEYIEHDWGACMESYYDED